MGVHRTTAVGSATTHVRSRCAATPPETPPPTARSAQGRPAHTGSRRQDTMSRAAPRRDTMSQSPPDRRRARSLGAVDSHEPPPVATALRGAATVERRKSSRVHVCMDVTPCHTRVEVRQCRRADRGDARYAPGSWTRRLATARAGGNRPLGRRETPTPSRCHVPPGLHHLEGTTICDLCGHATPIPRNWTSTQAPSSGG